MDKSAAVNGDPILMRGQNALFDDYAKIARRRGPRATARTAILQRSLALRDLIVYIASDGSVGTWDQLAQRLPDSALPPMDERWLAYLAYTVALQNLLPDDAAFAAHLYNHISRESLVAGKDNALHRKVHVELLMHLGEYESAQRQLKLNPILRELEDDYLWIDTLNPFRKNDQADADEWYRLFQERFTNKGLETPLLNWEGAYAPFDNVYAAEVPQVVGPLISVIMTTYQPSHTLEHSVRSILAQSWSNLEVILIDDGSSDDYLPTLRRVEQLDERLRLVRLSENVGTYGARNAGLKLARGEFITGNDSDDWSHPRRLERQVAPLLADPELTSTRSRALTVAEDLRNYRVGYEASRGNVSSLMFRRSVLSKVGGYDSSRKAADSEFMERLGHVTSPTLEVPEPLSLVRILEASLSRSDFRPLWRHESRRSYVSAYRWWHQHGGMRENAVLPRPDRPFPIPARFAVRRDGTEAYDVVFASEWRRYGGPQKSMIEEIRALRKAGLRVAVCQLYAARFISETFGKHCDAIQEMLNSGEVDEVYLEDPVSVRLLIVRYPPVLQFLPETHVRWDVERLIILANQAPAERDGTDIRYYVQDCTDNAERFFRCKSYWVPQGPVVRAAIQGSVDPDRLASFDMPGILDVNEWWTDRSILQSSHPVIGRHSRDDRMKWPERPSVLGAVYPEGDDVEVRIMGGVKALAKPLRGRRAPRNWVVFARDALDVREFLSSIDFFVYYQHSKAIDAFGRSTLEALASGCVTILPPELERTFGPGAVYAEPDEVMSTVWSYYEDPKKYLAQAQKGRAYVAQRFSHEKYQELVSEILASDRWPL